MTGPNTWLLGPTMPRMTTTAALLAPSTLAVSTRARAGRVGSPAARFGARRTDRLWLVRPGPWPGDAAGLPAAPALRVPRRPADCSAPGAPRGRVPPARGTP